MKCKRNHMALFTFLLCKGVKWEGNNPIYFAVISSHLSRRKVESSSSSHRPQKSSKRFLPSMEQGKFFKMGLLASAEYCYEDSVVDGEVTFFRAASS